MGRTRTKSNKIRPSKVISPPPSVSKCSPKIHALLEKAQSLIVECDYPLAERFIQRILENEPDHAEAREMLGIVLLETGELDGARMVSVLFEMWFILFTTNYVSQAFMSLVPPSPSSPDPPPPSAYLYLAQLTEDNPHAALAHYQSAVDILNTQLKGKGRVSEDNEAESELRSNIVKALVGMVEVWMDPSYDLWYVPASQFRCVYLRSISSFELRAETTCEELLGLALQTDPGNAEALQMLSSVRMSQQRPEEARDYLLQSYSNWKDLDPGMK
jgi:tetratricopeptide (TPR) repeat protein